MPGYIDDNCPVCDKCVKRNQRILSCNSCKNWTHLKCTDHSKNEFSSLENKDDWYCKPCIANFFPFNHFDNDIDFRNCVFAFSRSDQLNSATIKNTSCSTLFDNFCINENIDAKSNIGLAISNEVKYYSSSELNALLDTEPYAPGRNLAVIHINARSINKNYNNILLMLSSLTLKFDIITITETWIDDKYNQNVPPIPGYNYYSRPRKNKKGGGVAIYVRNDLQTSAINWSESVDQSSFESLFIQLNDSNTLVGVIYRPPDTDLDIFNREYTEVLNKVSAKRKIILSGDFNINLLNSEYHNETETFLESSLAHYLYPTITKPTRVCATTSTLIDNIFVNNPNDDYLSGILVTDISDHLPVFYITRQNIARKKSQKYKSISYRDMKDVNISNFVNTIENTVWDIPLDCCNVNVAYDHFINKFICLYNKSFPTKCKKIKICTANKPWITNGILKSISRKNKLYKEWLKKKTDSLLSKYKNYKNKLTNLIRSSERLYYHEKLQQHKTDIKQTWKIINSILNKNNNQEYPKELKINGNLITNEYAVANKFNEYFVNSGTDLAKKYHQ